MVVAPGDVRGVYTSWAACKAAVAGRHGVHIESARTAREARALLERSRPSRPDDTQLNGTPRGATVSGGSP